MKRIKLHTKFLILLSGISLIPLLLTALPTYFRFQKTLEGEAIKLQGQLAARAAAELSSFIVSNIRVLETVGALYNPEFPVNLKEANLTLQNTLFRNDNFGDLTIVDRDGREIIKQSRIQVINPADLGNISDTEAFKTVRDKGIFIGDLHIEKARPLFILGRQMTDARGNFLGAVFAQIDAKIMPQIMSDISVIAGNDGLAYMVNGMGIVIAHPDLSEILRETDLSETALIKVHREKIDRTSDSLKYYNNKDEHVLGSAYFITLTSPDLRLSEPYKTDWSIIIEQQYSTILVEADRSALFAVILSILVMLAAVGTAFLLSKRVSSPIESLSNVALEFGRGNLDYRTRISSNDEIGDLAKSFNKMAETISISIIRLKEEEQIISAERDKLSVILSGITNAVIAVDLQRNIVLFNKAAEAMTGLNSNDILGKPLADIIKISDEERILSIDDYCPIKNKSVASEGIIFQKNNLRLTNSVGSERFINLISGTIKEKLSIQLGAILTFQDITEEMRLDQSKKDFIAIASHEMRTPLTIIRGNTEYLLNKVDTDKNTGLRDELGVVLKNVKHLLDIVNDFFLVQDLEKRKKDIRPEMIDLMQVLTVVAADFSTLTAEKNIFLRINEPSDTELPPLLLDKEILEQICNNLIGNAVNNTQKGGITVSIEKLANALKIFFEDTSTGINPEDQAEIFTKFKAGKTYFKSTGYGSGLGLYIAKLLSEWINGSLKLEKSEPGIGSIFSLTLPLPPQK